MSQNEFQIFHNETEYIISIIYDENCIKVVLESFDDNYYWRGVFDKKYIEDITSKAGSYKTFQVFLKIIFSAFRRDSKFVLFDIMNSKDLQEMKKMISSRANLELSQVSSLGDSQKINKKYIILTYITEHENAHYPLPLILVDFPENDVLLRTISRLKHRIIKKIKSSALSPNKEMHEEMEELKKENCFLKSKNKQLESIVKRHDIKTLEKELDYVSLSSLPNEIERIKHEYEDKIKILIKNIDDLKRKINNTHQDIVDKNKNINDEFYFKEQEFLRIIKSKDDKFNELSTIFIQEKKKAEELIKQKINDINNLQRDFLFCRENEKKFKIKIANLEKEIENSKKKIDIATYGNIQKIRNYNHGLKPASAISFQSAYSNTSRYNGTTSFNSEKKYQRVFSLKKGKLRNEINSKILNYSSQNSNKTNSRYNSPSNGNRVLPSLNKKHINRTVSSTGSALKSPTTKKFENIKKSFRVREPVKDSRNHKDLKAKLSTNLGNSINKTRLTNEDINAKLLKIQSLLNINK